MSDDIPDRIEVDRFVVDHIDSIPHLEALLLLHRQHLERWTVEEVARRLWIEAEHARSILQDLVRDHLIIQVTGEQEQYSHRAEPKNDLLLQAVARAYRDEMIRISNMIHAKPSSAVRAFARAFRFTKEQGDMGPAVYILGALTTLACGVLLLRGYLQARQRLLLWSGLCFFGLTISNMLIFVDLVMFPEVDLYLWRLIAAAVAMALLLYGLIWDSK